MSPVDQRDTVRHREAEFRARVASVDNIEALFRHLLRVLTLHFTSLPRSLGSPHETLKGPALYIGAFRICSALGQLHPPKGSCSGFLGGDVNPNLSAVSSRWITTNECQPSYSLNLVGPEPSLHTLFYCPPA